MPDSDSWLAGAFAEVEFADLDDASMVKLITSDKFAAQMVGALDQLHQRALAAVLLRERFRSAVVQIKASSS